MNRPQRPVRARGRRHQIAIVLVAALASACNAPTGPRAGFIYELRAVGGIQLPVVTGEAGGKQYSVHGAIFELLDDGQARYTSRMSVKDLASGSVAMHDDAREYRWSMHRGILVLDFVCGPAALCVRPGPLAGVPHHRQLTLRYADPEQPSYSYRRLF